MTVKAVVFDFGGTLDTNGVHWCEKFWDAYQHRHVSVSKEEFNEAYVAAEKFMDGKINRDDSFLTTLKTQIEFQIQHLVSKGLIDPAAAGTLPDELSASCYADIQQVAEESERVVRELKKKYCLGLVSNFYGNMKRVLRELGLENYFNTVADSGEIGIKKPDPRIFQIALDNLGVLPAETVVVGDSYGQDVSPAKSIGCRTVWLDGRSWTKPENTASADYIIHSLSELILIEGSFCATAYPRDSQKQLVNLIPINTERNEEANMKTAVNVDEPKGKLGVLIAGINGAVSTTFLAGTLSIRKGLSKPIGSLTQMGTIRIGKRSEGRFPLIKDFVPLADLDQLEFGGWDIRDENAYEAARYAKVLDESDLAKVKDELESIHPMPAVFEQRYVVRLHGTYVKQGKTKYDLMEQLRQDIRNFKLEKKLDRLVLIWCGSTEIYLPVKSVHQTPASFEEGMKNNDLDIAPSMLYAWAAVSEGVPYINGAPNLTNDIPAIVELAHKNGVPIAGKDFKTGQTLIKTVIGPMLKARMLGLSGWFSSNILGNRDGEVLDDPGSFKTKEESKLSVLDYILQPELYPDLYKDYYHKVRINYYPPRGDNKEGWDNIDIFGWMNYPMQLKIDFLCRDSILAAPIALDLVLFTDLAQRAHKAGIQEWLSFYFKSPIHSKDSVPEHDLFIQSVKLKNTLRQMMGESPINFIDQNGNHVTLEEVEDYENWGR